jgi:hypothetical protein
LTPERRQGTVQVVVATTVMLSFISFWKAAAIVLSDLASSAYYAGGIAEHAVGKSAPWFILAIMLFAYAAACTKWCTRPWAARWPSFRFRPSCSTTC